MKKQKAKPFVNNNRAKIKFFVGVFLSIVFTTDMLGQSISGTITDKTGKPIPGANVYLENSYDGSSSDENGFYSFKTGDKGTKTLAVSCIGYEKYRQEIQLEADVKLNIALKEAINEMNAITITAGAFDISEINRAAVLQPYDVATTPGATADVTGALNALPSNNSMGEDGRLFVRGGEGHEARAYIDGMLINNFYGTSPEGLPTRGRFSPFLFKGQYFSSGGYSAEYGDALSSILSLNSIDLPIRSQTDFSLLSIGASVSHTKKWNKRSVFGEISHSDMEPYYKIVKQNVDWQEAPRSISGIFNYKERLKNGFFKIYYQGNKDYLSLNYRSPSKISEMSRVEIDNNFHYINTNINTSLREGWSLFSGISYSSNSDQIELNEVDKVTQEAKVLHLKTVLDGALTEKLFLKIGGEVNNEDDRFLFLNDTIEFIRNLNNLNASGFVEPEFTVSQNLIFRAGLRIDHSQINDFTSISPRLSMAYRTGNNSQFSMAYGQFYQKPLYEYLRFNQNLDHEKSEHYIFNWQLTGNEKVFRIEAFRKNYFDLVKYDLGKAKLPGAQYNGGSGYAQGIDVFWRDRQAMRNLEYWITYSLLDTKRDFKDFPYLSVPNFAAAHKLVAVSKYFIINLRSQVGATYYYQSGRHYHNPNLDAFNSQKTKSYHDVSINWSLILKQNLIIHAMANNILGFDPIFNYQYADNPDENGYYQGMAIKRPAKRFFFIGIFLTISEDKNANQLNNL